MTNITEQLIIDRLRELLSLVQIDDLQFDVEKGDLIEATAIYPVTGERACLIKLEVRESNKEIYIPNIHLPEEMKHLGLGKRMIWVIFMIGDQFGYKVFLTDLSDSFKHRMLERGALPTSQHDMLQIVKQTDLSSKNDPNNNKYIEVKY